MRKLGELLVEEGLITQEQLENALMLQKSKNKKIGKVLIEMGYVTESQVVDSLCKNTGIEFVDCSKFDPPKELFSLLTRETLEKKKVFPVGIKGRTIVLAMADPFDYNTVDEVSFLTGKPVQTVISTETGIISAIRQKYGTADKAFVSAAALDDMSVSEQVVFGQKEEAGEEENINIQTLYEISEAPPVVKLVNMILANAIKSRASDIHIEPFPSLTQVRYRVDGELRKVLNFPKRMQNAVISRIKIISNLNITIRRLPQDGRTSLKYEDRYIDLRIAILPTVFGETVVIRILDRMSGLIPLSKLGISERAIKLIIEFINQPQGMLLVTGPTGSGKTTTLYAILQQFHSETEKVITIEDPVEYELIGITQIAVNEKIGLTFANILRTVLRQDPDTVMVGEIRDHETAETAAKAALTGHLVLTTLHTNDSVSTITRLLDLDIKPYLVNSSVSGVLSQRILRRICEHCKETVEISGDLLNAHEEIGSLKKCFKGRGCSKCDDTGYKGQVGVYEFLRVTGEIRGMISEYATEEELRDAAKSAGMVALFEDALEKVESGLTTIEEVLSKIPCFDVAERKQIKTEPGRAVESYKPEKCKKKKRR